MSAGKTRMGGVFVEITAETRKFFSELSKINKSLSALGESVANVGSRMAAIGGIVTAPIMGAAAAFAIFGDSVAKMAIRTGLSTEAVSGLSYAAQQSGTDIDTLAKGMRSMRSSLDDAATGGTKASQAFAALGLNVEAMRGMSPEEQFYAIADALAAVPDAATRAALATQIFGKAGVSLIPMLAQGAGGIRALVDQAARLGVVIDQETADAASRLGDAMNDIATAMKGVAMAVGGAVAPLLTGAAKIISGLVAEIAKFVQENGKLVQIALVAGGAITGLGAALTAAGYAAIGLSAAFSAIGAILATVLSPVALLIAAFASLVAFGPQIQQMLGRAFGGAGQVIGSVLGMIGEPLAAAINNAGVVLADLGTIATNTFDGIFNAITAGNLMLAFDILMAGLYAGWARGSEALTNAIAPWIVSVQNLFTDLGTWTAALWDGLWVSIVGATDLAGATLMGMFDNIVNSILKAWDVLEAGIRKSWNYIQSFFSEGFNLQVENMRVDSEMTARARARDLSRPGIAARVESANMQDARRRDESRQRQEAMFQNAKDEKNERRQDAQRAEDDRRQNTLDAEANLAQLTAQAAEQAAEVEDQRRRDAQRKVEAGAGAGAAAMTTQAEVAGTFSAFGIGGLSFGSRQIDLLKQIADNTARDDQPVVAE